MNATLQTRANHALFTSAFAPSVTARILRAKGDLRLGVPIVLTAGSDALIVVAIEALTEHRLSALLSFGGNPQISITRHRACALGLENLPDCDVCCATVPADVTLAALRTLAAQGQDARTKIPPLDIRTGTSFHHAAVALAKSVNFLPATLTIPVTYGAAIAQRYGLSAIDVSDVLTDLKAARIPHVVSSAHVPMTVHDAGRVHVFRPDDGGIEHYAIEIGQPDHTQPVLVRLHSACFTGDVMGSLKCDCGPQLQAACSTMASNGGGVLLYLNQEGRGIGMANKMRAYALQHAGHDTVEANNHLGFDDDERDFRIGSALLQALGVTKVRLLTNNPAKVHMLQAHGITIVERVPLVVGKTVQNAHYLATKASKSGHLLK